MNDTDKERAEMAEGLIAEALNEWPQFEDGAADTELGEDVNGGAMVEWFGEWRERVLSMIGRVHDSRRPEGRSLHAVEIVETVDGAFMVLVNGFQWGGDVDASGAGNATWETYDAASSAYWDARADRR